MKKGLIFLLVLLSFPVLAKDPVDTQVLHGKCSEESVIIDGAIDHENDTKEIPFFCDLGIVIFYDNRNDHISITFAKSNSASKEDSPPDSSSHKALTFAGFMKEDGIHLDVDGLYIGSNRFVTSGGQCQFAFGQTKLDAIICVTRVDTQHRKIMPLVEFVIDEK